MLKITTGVTKFHIADIVGSDEKFIQFLIDNGAELNARNDYLRSPLHLAVEAQNVVAVKILTEHGADVNLQNHYGITHPFFRTSQSPNS